MRLFIQIPCKDEEGTLPAVISDLPRKIDGIDEIRVLVVDDGSTDRTVEVARELGVDNIVRNRRNLGLSTAFGKGLDACLHLGADIIVNTDGDNQYKGEDIAKLVRPIVEKRADIVVGCRDISGHKEFSWYKKALQKLGSRVVRQISGTSVPDTTSGFRAIGRSAAIKLSHMNAFSYTLEMLIQAGRIMLDVDWVHVGTNPRLRESRLFKSIPDFMFRQTAIILKVYLFYFPMRFFGWLAGASFSLSIILVARIAHHLWFFSPDELKFKTGTGILLLFTAFAGVLFLACGFLGSVLSGLRFLMMDLRGRVRNMELHQKIAPHDIEIITIPDPEEQSEKS
jgi:glycosyltransferase involved in cell wall biosynthesis